MDFAEKAFNQLGFGLLCIGVWFWFSLYWGLVCFCYVLLVLGFGLLYEQRDRGFDLVICSFGFFFFCLKVEQINLFF